MSILVFVPKPCSNYNLPCVVLGRNFIFILPEIMGSNPAGFLLVYTYFNHAATQWPLVSLDSYNLMLEEKNITSMQPSYHHKVPERRKSIIWMQPESNPGPLAPSIAPRPLELLTS